MTSSTVRISTKIITWIYNNAGKIVLQRRYYSYQRIFLIHEYGVWLEIECIRRFFFTAVPRVTIRSNVILVSRLRQTSINMRAEVVMMMNPNLVSKTHLHPTQVGLGIFQAIHCEVIQVSTVYCAVCNLQPVYWSTWLTHEFCHLIVLKLLSAITRNHSTKNACCCFFLSVKPQMMTVPSIDEMILGLS